VTEVARRPSIRRPNDGGVIDAVRPASIAAELGLLPGDRIVAIGGQRLRDAVDFQFLAADEIIEVEAVRGGRTTIYEIEKDPDEDLGIDFQDAAFDGVRQCNNKCFFCFLKGNPKGMRKTLYVKDDDYRLSFFHGNFVTLTNLTEDDWSRLEEQRLSPLNVSVHATDLDLRRYLLGNANAPDVIKQLQRLGKIGIQAHTQVVLCPGVNDGAALDRTIADLAALYPTVQTISIVPVGATETAEERIAPGAHANEITGISAAYARSIVEQARPHQRQLRRERGATVVHLADEFYLTAGLALPSAAHYDGFGQYENGIGMSRSLVDDWSRAKRRESLSTLKLGSRGLVRESGGANGRQTRSPGAPIGSMTWVCGTLVAALLGELALDFTAHTGVAVDVVPIENRFFGPRVNVAGLLVAADIESQLCGHDPGDLVVLPRYTLDYTGARFLDDVAPDEMQSRLGVPIAFASRLSEVLQFLRDGVSSGVTGARPGATTNGKSWVDFSETKGGGTRQQPREERVHT
jgi:putative radical SAM enzyme (TIGR03279 family)